MALTRLSAAATPTPSIPIIKKPRNKPKRKNLIDHRTPRYSTPCYCLICLQQVLWLPGPHVTGNVFNKLKEYFGLDLFDWDLGTVPFPICKLCTKEFLLFFKDYEKLEKIVSLMDAALNDIKEKILSSSKDKCLTQEWRINNFRKKFLRLKDKMSCSYLPGRERSAAAAAPATNDQFALDAAISSIVETTEPEEYVTIGDDDDNIVDYSDNNPASSPLSSPPRKRPAAPSTRKGNKSPSKKLRKHADLTPLEKCADGRMLFEGHEILKIPFGYSCKTCGLERKSNNVKECVNLNQIKFHIKGIHLKSYQCANCKNYYASPRILNQHNQRTCLKSKESCEICGKPVRLLNSHLWTHKNEEEKEQGRILGQVPREVITWEKKRKTKKMKKCPTCEKMINYSHFKRHTQIHLQSEDEKRNFQCDVAGCKKTLSSQNSLEMHKKYVHIIKTRAPLFTCTECPKLRQFYIKRKFREHVENRHRNKKPRIVPILPIKKIDVPLPLPPPLAPLVEEVKQKEIVSKTGKRKYNYRPLPEKKKSSKVQISKEEIKRRLVVYEQLPPLDFNKTDGKLYFEEFEVLEIPIDCGFMCSKCFKEFRKDEQGGKTLGFCEGQVKRHIQIAHLGRYTCHFCENICKSYKDLLEHRKSHSKQGKLCPSCSRYLKSEELRLHLWSHKNVEEMVEMLKSAGQGMSERVRNWNHTQAKNNEFVIKCFVRGCKSEPFLNVDKLQQHIMDEHPTAINI